MSITFNGTNSDSLGVIVEKIPNPQIAARRVTTEIVPGRNGVLLQDDKSFATVNLSYAMHISAEGGELFPKARKVAAWLLATPGFLRLEDSYEDDVFRLARYNGGIDITSYFFDHGTFNCQFECQPQRFLKSGESEIVVQTYTQQDILHGEAGITPIPYSAKKAYAYGGGSFTAVFLDEDGALVGDMIDTTGSASTPIPNGAATIACVWNNAQGDYAFIVGVEDSDGNRTPIFGFGNGSPMVYNPTDYEARPLLKFVDTSVEPTPVSQTLVKLDDAYIGSDGEIYPVQASDEGKGYDICDEVSVTGYTYAYITGNSYVFYDANHNPISFVPDYYKAKRTYMNNTQVIIPSGASVVVIGTKPGAPNMALSLKAARANPGTNAVTINGTTISLDFSAHDTIYLDCDLHDAYYLDGSSANDKVTFSSTIDKYPTFPGLFPGENTVIVRDGENLNFSIIPRWWVL